MLPRSGSACTSGGRSFGGRGETGAPKLLYEKGHLVLERLAQRGDLTHVLRSSGSFQISGETLTLMAANRCNRPLQRMSSQSERLAVTCRDRALHGSQSGLAVGLEQRNDFFE